MNKKLILFCVLLWPLSSAVHAQSRLDSIRLHLPASVDNHHRYAFLASVIQTSTSFYLCLTTKFRFQLPISFVDKWRGILENPAITETIMNEKG